MAVTVSGTTITFNDGTTQTTAGGAVNTSTVLSATAGASVGAVGTYAFCLAPSSSATAGSTYAGSSLRYISTTYNPSYCNPVITYNNTGSTPSGTWRAMGGGGGSANAGTLFLRIS